MGDGLKITCTLDEKKLAAIQRAIGVKSMRRVVARSLNRAGVTVRKEGAQKVKERLRLKIGEIKEALPIKNKPRGDQPISAQFVEIRASSKPISMSKFAPKQVGRGVTVNITGKRTLLKHAFIAKMKNASRGSVFIRSRFTNLGQGSRKRKKEENWAELPIAKKVVTTIHTFFLKHYDALAKIGMARFDKEFDANLSHAMRQAGAK